MPARKLDKNQWRMFFDRLSKTLQGQQAEIEVASLSFGDQVEAELLPLHGITYDPNDDLVEVALEGLDHMIRKPREIYLEDWTKGLTTIEIVDADGTKQVVKLQEPLMLASPAT
jgi:uncharacterized protein DUF5335